MPKYEYDLLNILLYVSLIVVTLLYNSYFDKTQVWKMILVSQILIFIMTALMLINVLRINLEYGISDIWINVFINLLGTMSMSWLAYLPMHVVLTAFVPDNIETSAMAVVTASYVWSYMIMPKMIALVYCQIFQVDDEHMENYPKVIMAKLVLLFPMTAYLYIYPRNEDVYRVANILRYDRLSLRRETDLKYLGFINRSRSNTMRHKSIDL